MILLRQWLFSLTFFTRVPSPISFDATNLSLARCAWTFPLMGAWIGAVTAMVYAGLTSLGLPALSAAWVALIAQILLTGGLHEDGLADTADGLATGRSTEQKLAIMRDSRVGSFGVLALIASLGLRASLIAAIPPTAALGLFAVTGSASRFVMAWLMFQTPAARTDGLAANAGAISARDITLCTAIAIALWCMMIPLWAACSLLAVVASVAWATRRMALRQFGGITGDVLGASQQLVEMAALMLWALTMAGS